MSNKNIMTAAVVQIDVMSGDFENNFLKIASFVEKAAAGNADVVIFPELVDRGYVLSEYREIDSAIYHDQFNYLHSLSVKHNITIIWGNSFTTQAGCMNVQLLTNRHFPVKPVYFKQHLFPGEESVFTPGSSLGRYHLDACNLGFQICFDIRYPESLRAYLPSMPEVIVVSAAWPLARISHWKSLLIARAIENQCYIIASNRVGKDASLRFGGTSLIISPKGEILAEASEDKDELISHPLDISDLKEYRRSFPVL